MRDVRYKHHPGVGGPGPWTRADLVKFLFALPYFFAPSERKQPMPPLHILNELLQSGKCDAGMSGACEWKPFELSETEYRKLAEELLSRPDLQFVEDAALSACKNFAEWRSKVTLRYRAARKD